ncbi:MAG: hypothetical protein ABIA66_01440 [Candidatus Omnitrophota bacterium]
MGALAKVRGWQLVLIKVIVVPILKMLSSALKKRAAETPDEWDDIAAAAFETVVAFLESPESFEET